MQNSQKDGVRRQAAGQILSKVQECASNNGGDYTNCGTWGTIGPYLASIKLGNGSAPTNANTNNVCGANKNTDTVGIVVNSNNGVANSNPGSATVCVGLNNNIKYQTNN